MEYHKEIKKTGRMIQTRGPRDSQYKLESELIVELRRQITDLKSEPRRTDVGPVGEFTAEKLDSEIRNAVKNAVKETKTYYTQMVDGLKEKESELLKKLQNVDKEHSDKIKSLEKRLSSKNNLIESLRTEKDSIIKNLIEEQTKKMEELTRSMANREYVVEEDSDRPQMEETFVDPLEKGAGSGLVPHIDVEDVSMDEKEDMQEKVDKLRSLMCGLKK